MGCGSSGTNTVVDQSQPPQQFLDAYSNVASQAQAVAAQPLSQYSGPTVAGFTPAQNQAFSTVNNAQGIANPYINAGSEYISNSTAPVLNGIAGFTTSPDGSTTMSPASMATAVQGYESPYTANVVQATEAELNNQNAQQQAQLTGNAAAQGALGGDRLGVAQAVLAGQQDLSEAPTIAGLENTGYTTALGEANTEQQTGLSANEANAWLNSQAGYGMANLGNEAESTALTGASAQLQTGALQQELAQEELNVPEENFLQAQAYPLQITGWEAGIDEGLGGASGGTSTSTSPGPSTASELTGLGLTGIAGVGLANDAGLFSSSAAPAATDAGTMVAKRGGRIPGFAYGGITPSGGIFGTSPGSTSTTTVPSDPAAAVSGAIGDIGTVANIGKMSGAFGANGWLSGLGSDISGAFDSIFGTTAGVGAANTAAGAAGANIAGGALATAGTAAAIDASAGYGGAAAGGELASLGAASAAAAKRGGRIPMRRFDDGGLVSGFNAGTLDAPTDASIGFVPSASTTGSSRSTIPSAPGATQQPDPASQGLTILNTAGGLSKILKQKNPASDDNDMRRGGRARFDSGGSTSGFTADPTLSTIEEAQSLSALTSADAQARGGAVRRHFDVGGQVSGFSAKPMTPGITQAPATGTPMQAAPQASAGVNDAHVAAAIQKLANPSGRPGFDVGGAALPTAAFAGQAASGGISPNAGNYLKQLQSMSPEQLQELSVRVPPTSPQGQMIQRAVKMQRMTPNQPGMAAAAQAQQSNAPQNPFSPTTSPSASVGNGQGGFGGVSTQPFARSGGRIAGFASGGSSSSGAASAPTLPPSLPVGPGMTSFTSPGGVTVPILPTAGVAPGSTLSTLPTSNFTAPPTSSLPSNTVTYPSLGIGAPAPAPPPSAFTAADASFLAQQMAASQNQFPQGNGDARGGRIRGGFADGGDIDDDTVLSDNGSYVPLSTMQRQDGDSSTPVAGVGDIPLPPPQKPPAPNTDSTAAPSPPGGRQTTSPSPPTPSAPPNYSRPTITPKSGFADSPWLPVLEAGLAIAGGRSPYALENIGQGGLQGVKALEGQQERFDTRAEKQATIDEDANKLAETANYHSKDLNIQGQRNSDAAEEAQDRNATEQQRNANEAKYQSGQLDIQGQKLNQDRFTWQAGLGPDPNDPTKQVSGAWRFSTRQDEPPTFTAGAALTAQQKIDQAAKAAELRAATSPAYPATGFDANGQPVTGTYEFNPETGKREFKPGVTLTGKAGGQGAGSTSEWKYNTWLAVHPDDKQGALDFVAGHKQMTDQDAMKFAYGQAQRELGQGADKKDIDARAAEVAQAVQQGKAAPPPAGTQERSLWERMTGGGNPQPAPQSAPQGAPQPAAQPQQPRAAAPAQAAPAVAAQPKPATPQILASPPPIEQRVPGQTIVQSPKGYFQWQSDGWHPIPAPQQ